MKKTTYWKDVWRTFVASKGRMLSIALLMALGNTSSRRIKQLT